MNLALDSSSTGITRQQIQNETIVIREQNETMQNQLEQVFKDRQRSEHQNQQLEEAIIGEKSRMNEMIFSLSPDQQSRYREYQMTSEKLKAENSEIHQHIEHLIKQKEKLSSTVMSSQARLEAVKMQSKLRESIVKRNQLKEEENNRLTPAQEREKLINDVKSNNQAISSINKQMKTVSEQLKEDREQLAQIEQDLDEGSTEKLLKYRELRKRDEMMTNFMEVFPTQLTKEKQSKLKSWHLFLIFSIYIFFSLLFSKDVENLKNQITFMIEHITLQGINSKFNTTTSTKLSLNSEKFDLSTQDGLLREYGKLQIQLKQLKLLEKRMGKQLSDLRTDESNFLRNIQKFNNLDTLRNEYATKYEELSTALHDLQDKKRVTENVVEDSERRNQSIKVEYFHLKSSKELSIISISSSHLVHRSRWGAT